MTDTLDRLDAPDLPVAPRRSVEPLVAAGAVVALAVLVLTRGARLLEPDDYAYRASIAALAHGWVRLSDAQYRALVTQVGQVAQWHHLSSGAWISEKNPGYPFLALPFYLAHALRVAPLFYGSLGAWGLYHGARAWLGRRAGAIAAWLFCLSGMAATFAWRATMPTFTDAALVAAGAGALVWAMASPVAPARRRAVVGLAGFAALEAATFVRYTDAIELAVAVLAVVAFARGARVGRGAIALWLGSVALFGAGVLAFDAWAYGSATSTGYSAGEISFSLSSLGANLRGLPLDLVAAAPVALAAAAGVALVVARAGARPHDPARRLDLAVGASLAAGWLGLWVLYLTYTWTADQAGRGGLALAVHLIRFYVPALGPMALLGAAALVRLPRAAAGAAVAALTLAAVAAFSVMASGSIGPGHGAGPGGGPGGPGVGPARSPAGGPPGPPGLALSRR